MANGAATEGRGNKFETKAKRLILPGYGASKDIHTESEA